MTHRKRVVVRLAGGLGNQMFEYAMGRSLALRQGAQLALDTWTGFVTDRLYHRTYELDSLAIDAVELGARSPEVVRGNFWRALIRARRSRSSGTWVRQLAPRSTLLIEQEHKFLPAALDTVFTGTCWVDGFWQSPGYFQAISDTVAQELLPPAPLEGPARALGDEMARGESVAVGIRLYEESQNPLAHAREGRMKRPRDVEHALRRLCEEYPDVRAYVFCTHHAPFLDDIRWPSGTQFVTHDEGFGETLSRLWMMTQCRHHLFTNSTYYWWGAWLSEYQRGREGQRIIAADNFINVDALPRHWERF